jgi:tmRNA-binding protein
MEEFKKFLFFVLEEKTSYEDAYGEIGIKDAIELAFKEYELKDKYFSIKDIKSILPTDEEIKEVMTTTHFHHETGRYRKIRLDRIQGAKILRGLIEKRLLL